MAVGPLKKFRHDGLAALHRRLVSKKYVFGIPRHYPNLCWIPLPPSGLGQVIERFSQWKRAAATIGQRRGLTIRLAPSVYFWSGDAPPAVFQLFGLFRRTSHRGLAGSRVFRSGVIVVRCLPQF